MTSRHRQGTRRETQKTPLVVLAGLPHSIYTAAARTTVENLSPSPRVISHPSGADDRFLYKKQTVTSVMQAVTGYAARQIKAENTPPTPNQILFAYVPSDDEEQLLAEFDFFVFPVRLTCLAEYDESGHQFRHDREMVEKYVVSSLQIALRNFMEVKGRLSRVNAREPLFLPPLNFKVSNTERMADIFKDMRRAARPWGDPLPNIRTTKVTHEQLPKHVRKGAHREVLSDSRSLLFPHDQSNHGPARELAPACSHEDRRQFMQSSFRFGVPLTDGYHHDVQFAGGSLGGETFECSRKGHIKLDSQYANVYPNDFVRPSKK